MAEGDFSVHTPLWGLRALEENSKKWNTFRTKDQLLWLENHFGELLSTKTRKKSFKALAICKNNV